MDKEFAIRIFKAVDEKLEIEEAFIWEGSGRHKFSKIDANEMVFLVGGSSEVEHEGDVNGIRNHVSGLRGQTCEVELDGVIYTTLIKSATCTITEDRDGNSDGDYSVFAKGEVTIKYNKKV